MQGGASARTAAYWVVREERTRSDNAADGRSWTGSYDTGVFSYPGTFSTLTFMMRRPSISTIVNLSWL